MGKPRKSSKREDKASSTVAEIESEKRRKSNVKVDFEIDGRKLEGGGQLLRVALCLSALTEKSIHVTNIRGNRQGQRGLKNQHLACAEALAAACDAYTYIEGARVGSQDLLLTFGPRKNVDGLTYSITHNGEEITVRRLRINLPTPGAITLVLQALLPYLLFAKATTATVLSVRGGTHTTSSPSIDYIDSVLLPNLVSFGIPSWCLQRLSPSELQRTFTTFGQVDYLVRPLSDHSLRLQAPQVPLTLPEPTEDVSATGEIHAYVVSSSSADRSKSLEAMSYYLASSIFSSSTFQSFDIVRTHFATVGSPSVQTRVNRRDDEHLSYEPFAIETGKSRTTYVLLVAIRNDGMRIGADHRQTWSNKSRSDKPRQDLNDGSLDSECKRAATSAVAALTQSWQGCERCGTNMDEHMRDQVIIFLGLLGGRIATPILSSSDERGEDPTPGDTEGTHGLTLHAQTAIWVTKLMLGVEFDEDGAGVKEGWLAKQEQERKLAEQLQSMDFDDQA